MLASIASRLPGQAAAPLSAMRSQRVCARVLRVTSGMCALMFAACATPNASSDDDFKRFLDADARVTGIAFNIERGALPYCEGHVRYAGGVFLAHPDIAAERFHQAALRLLGDQGVVIYAVFRGSPAERAGLEAGDVVESINGINEIDAIKTNAMAADTKHQIWRVLRGRETLTVSYDTAAICDYPVRLVSAHNFAAAAEEPGVIFVTTGLVASTTDDELAFVLAHETAHVVLGHLARSERLYHVMHTQPPNLDPHYAVELEADYVGAYFAALAHYDMENSLAIFEVTPEDEPGGSHPPRQARLAAAERVSAELARKLAAGEPLTPDGYDLAVASTASFESAGPEVAKVEAAASVTAAAPGAAANGSVEKRDSVSLALAEWDSGEGNRDRFAEANMDELPSNGATVGLAGVVSDDAMADPTGTSEPPVSNVKALTQPATFTIAERCSGSPVAAVAAKSGHLKHPHNPHVHLALASHHHTCPRQLEAQRSGRAMAQARRAKAVHANAHALLAHAQSHGHVRHVPGIANPPHHHVAAGAHKPTVLASAHSFHQRSAKLPRTRHPRPEPNGQPIKISKLAHAFLKQDDANGLDQDQGIVSGSW